MAYAHGWFPMGEDDGSVRWYMPYERALFPIEGVHVSRSLARAIRRNDYEIRFDTAFELTMRSCLRPGDNWINEEIIAAYCAIHFEGWGHSVEVWREDRLVGGLYGIGVGGCFSAESMFHRETDCSKIALWAAVNKCRELGFLLFDAQVMNPHLDRMGAYPMPQFEYLRELAKFLDIQTPWSTPLVPERTPYL